VATTTLLQGQITFSNNKQGHHHHHKRRSQA